MADGDGERIGRVLLRFSWQFEQRLNHVLDLILGCRTGPDDGLFYFSRLVLKYRQSLVNARDDSHPPCMAQLQGRICTPRHEDLLDSQLIGYVFSDDLRNTGKNLVELFREGRLVGGADAAACNIFQVRANGAEHTISRHPGTWIDS